MPHRMLWSVLDVAGLICLGQATILAQRQAGPALRLDPLAEVTRADQGLTPQGTRIAQTADAVVVSMALKGRVPPEVDVDAYAIRLRWTNGELTELPIPAAADPARYRLKHTTEDLRLVFKRKP